MTAKGMNKMKSDAYSAYFTAEYMMGPNSVRLLDSLLETCPLQLQPGAKVMDIGCGTGLTSMFLAKETGADVTALDWWIDAEDNRRRLAAWGLTDRVTPVHGDATQMRFAPEAYDAVISVDAYHYFGAKENFFAEKILPVVKKGGTVLIGIPGIKNEFDGRSEELLSPWLGDETYMFQSALRWKQIIGTHDDIAEIETWEMPIFDIAWQEWFDSGHKYAMGDRKFFDTLIQPYTSFVGIMVRKKA